VKFGYAIVLALIALVFVSGFAVADRLPKQVPENQVFTIDTIIDATGQVSDSSSMQWVLDYKNDTTYYADGLSLTSTTAYGKFFTADEIDELEDLGATVTTVSGGTDLYHIASLSFDKLDSSKALSTDLAQLTGVSTLSALYNAITTGTSADHYYGYTSTDSGSIHDSMLEPTESIAILTWSDELRSNGGKTSLSKNIDFDSKNKAAGVNNLETEKVLTYASTEGAHLTGAEAWSLDVAGSYDKTADTIRCVFASSSSKWFPAFCNVVKAKSELVNVNSAQISTKGAARAVASTGDVPAALSYQIAVTPDSNSGSGFADGTIKTMFGGSIMEARANHLEPSATNSWKDTASVTGGIKNFQKTFDYTSGFTI